jgi:F0F1-type ATP synthase assembly protein I
MLSPNKKKGNGFAQISLLAAVPAILVAAPLVGLFGGKWLDSKFGTEPYLMIGGVVLGFVAGAREIMNLVRKSQSLEDDKKKENDKR